MKTYALPGLKAKPKARPLSGKGRMFVPREYLAWKQEFRDRLASAYQPVPSLGPVAIDIELHGPARPRGDLDNLAGAILDAIQPPRARGDVRAQRVLEAAHSLEERLAAAPGVLIADDKQVHALSVAWVKNRQRAIVLHLKSLE
jgi:hypothetical protein